MSNVKDQPFARIAADCVSGKVPFPEKLVSKYERIARQLNEFWGRKAASDYLNELIFPSRPGRQGFSPEVAAEILALKNLHENKYARVGGNVWDPYSLIYEDTAKKIAAPGNQSQFSQDGGTAAARSFYSTRNPLSETGRHRSTVIATLYPPTALGRTSTQPGASAIAVSERDEILQDAEKLLDAGRMHSGTALLEQLIAVHPQYTPYPYLRLLAIYYELERREDFDWVSQRLSERFSCSPVRWVLLKEECWEQIDRVAAELAKLAR